MSSPNQPNPPSVNADAKTVSGFGDEWSRFDQSALGTGERDDMFDRYFSVFPKSAFHANAIGADFGCGSGRWAACVAPQVGKLICVDPSDAIHVAQKNLSTFSNCEFQHRTIDAVSINDRSLDFGYSLGVLHHIPDTQKALNDCVRKLKDGAPFLVYLYYAFDNRPAWYRLLWAASDALRKGVSALPHGLRYFASQVFAISVYFPLARTAKLLERLGLNVQNFPLAFYRDLSFYTMRTDALDRFGTRLEQRFTKAQITDMMQRAGLSRIVFSDQTPFWCAVGYRDHDTR